MVFNSVSHALTLRRSVLIFLYIFFRHSLGKLDHIEEYLLSYGLLHVHCALLIIHLSAGQAKMELD